MMNAYIKINKFVQRNIKYFSLLVQNCFFVYFPIQNKIMWRKIGTEEIRFSSNEKGKLKSTNKNPQSVERSQKAPSAQSIVRISCSSSQKSKLSSAQFGTVFDSKKKDLLSINNHVESPREQFIKKFNQLGLNIVSARQIQDQQLTQNFTFKIFDDRFSQKEQQEGDLGKMTASMKVDMKDSMSVNIDCLGGQAIYKKQYQGQLRIKIEELTQKVNYLQRKNRENDVTERLDQQHSNQILFQKQKQIQQKCKQIQITEKCKQQLNQNLVELEAMIKLQQEKISQVKQSLKSSQQQNFALKNKLKYVQAQLERRQIKVKQKQNNQQLQAIHSSLKLHFQALKTSLGQKDSQQWNYKQAFSQAIERISRQRLQFCRQNEKLKQTGKQLFKSKIQSAKQLQNLLEKLDASQKQIISLKAQNKKLQSNLRSQIRKRSELQGKLKQQIKMLISEKQLLAQKLIYCEQTQKLENQLMERQKLVKRRQVEVENMIDQKERNFQQKQMFLKQKWSQLNDLVNQIENKYYQQSTSQSRSNVNFNSQHQLSSTKWLKRQLYLPEKDVKFKELKFFNVPLGKDKNRVQSSIKHSLINNLQYFEPLNTSYVCNSDRKGYNNSRKTEFKHNRTKTARKLQQSFQKSTVRRHNSAERQIERLRKNIKQQIEFLCQ